MTIVQRPAVGRVVHYVSYGTPGGEYASRCRAAIVTEVSPLITAATGQHHVGLAVLNPTGLFFRSLAGEGGCPYDDGDRDGEVTYRPGTWHWPEKVYAEVLNGD